MVALNTEKDNGNTASDGGNLEVREALELFNAVIKKTTDLISALRAEYTIEQLREVLTLKSREYIRSMIEMKGKMPLLLLLALMGQDANDKEIAKKAWRTITEFLSGYLILADIFLTELDTPENSAALALFKAKQDGTVMPKLEELRVAVKKVMDEVEKTNADQTPASSS